MGSATITTVGEGLCIRLPDDIAADLELREGDQVAIAQQGATILIRSLDHADEEPLQEFSSALRRLRARVREVGGISQGEIDEAIRRARSEPTGSRG